MNFTIKNEEIQNLNNSETVSFPKYTSQLINWANQNAQGTRPRVVGQLSELFPEYQNGAKVVSITNWQEWYLEHYPNAIENATDKIFGQVENLKVAIQLIDREMVKKWVEDLVIAKTFNGMYVQKAILSTLASKKGLAYRLAYPEEESIGIDGYVGDVAYSIKPNTYKTMNRLSERIDVKMIYYTKTKNCLKIEVDD
ncbi:MAG: MjaI family restriction endonuclease [Clostridiales bacterium]|nr:MjaI family restriction endonuclease [Clostridiales bacterium]